jgi:anti-sigma regulatory factor (Ser/Thr protein kinase)
VSAFRAFPRSFDSIETIFEFTSDFFARQQIDPRLLAPVDLAVEELFTNMVKYSPGGDAAVRIDLAKVAGGVEVALTDYGVEPFDITQSPEVDVNLPIEQRKPGGLGLHLVRRLVDSMQYEYDKASRRSRITFRKTLPGKQDGRGEGKAGGEDARD